jgi:hypothetical protein
MCAEPDGFILFQALVVLGLETRIPQLKLSEGQTWRSEDIGVFSFKVFFDASLAASICLIPLRRH